MCKVVVARYGGTVEKFIGDAVMAVWGAPTAMEDDAVRAALGVVQGVTDIASAVGEPGFVLRAGVLTGEAAVSHSTDGEGMVIGDLVNTASRIQSAAKPGTVFVGDTTKRVTEVAIEYQDAGSHELVAQASLRRDRERSGSDPRMLAGSARGRVRRVVDQQ